MPGLAQTATREAFTRAVDGGQVVLVARGDDLVRVSRSPKTGKVTSRPVGTVPPTRAVTPGTSRRLK